MSYSALAAKKVCQGDVDVSCSSKGQAGSRPRPLPRVGDSPSIARLPLGRSDPSASATSHSDVRLDLKPAKPLAKQATAPSATETIPLPREKQKKTRGSENASRQLEVNSHNSQENSGNVATARAEERHMRSRGRQWGRDSSGGPKGFWDWSW